MLRNRCVSASTQTSPNGVVRITLVSTQNPGRCWNSTVLRFFHSGVCSRWRSLEGINGGGILGTAGRAGLAGTVATRPSWVTGRRTPMEDSLVGPLRALFAEIVEGGTLVSICRISARLSSSFDTAATSPPRSLIKVTSFFSWCRRCCTVFGVIQRFGNTPLSYSMCRASGSQASLVQYSRAKTPQSTPFFCWGTLGGQKESATYFRVIFFRRSRSSCVGLRTWPRNLATMLATLACFSTSPSTYSESRKYKRCKNGACPGSTVGRTATSTHQCSSS
mmetsp:Transcript_18558/g.41129  ORF Transcript_18558/g.41129 Transcript_18558/m.41129 type:complete len:277 (-) Transcript_18558:406-1236(-)